MKSTDGRLEKSGIQRARGVCTLPQDSEPAGIAFELAGDLAENLIGLALATSTDPTEYVIDCLATEATRRLGREAA
jgi:hypothetical protein